MNTYIINKRNKNEKTDAFQAIADHTSREIINLVAFKPLNLNAIADNFNVSRPAISQHVNFNQVRADSY